ncbi:MAG: 1-acyl-sn-glycerol-3-phosphate acyltransferase [Bacteroidales bacterium]|nr:1-acyl-sn-glycerol-3-phosphate acyltransferase [Bacteroidales bacterium]
MAQSKITGAARNIHKRNFIFHILRHYVDFVFYQYYSKVEVTGSEKIPPREPVIFAPNHQNALMDALIVLFSCGQDVVFLARADLFRKKFLAFLLNSLKMLPVFRQRDGAGELGKNQEIFDITVDVLNHRHYLCLMPEGNHGDHRRLRPLVKGIFRIAFKAQEPHGNKPFVRILPTGLDFGHYVKQNQTLLINYGDPIEVSDYWDQYEENPARGINALKERLAGEMKPLMIHIETEEFYEAVLGLRTVFNERMREILEIKGSKLSDRFVADKHMIDCIDRAIEKDEEKVRVLAGKVKSYVEGVESMKIRDWVVRSKGYGFGRSLWRYLTLIVTFPLFLFGFVTNAISYFLPVRMVRNFKDLQFHASVKTGIALLMSFPLSYLLQTLLVGIFTGPWWIWAAYLVSLYPMGKIALYWYFRWKKTVRGSWFRRQLRGKNGAAVELVKLREEIVGLTEEIIGAK